LRPILGDEDPEEAASSPLIDRSGRARAAPFNPPAGATVPQRDDPQGAGDQGQDGGVGDRMGAGDEQGGNVSDSMDSESDDDEKEIERQALLKREAPKTLTPTLHRQIP